MDIYQENGQEICFKTSSSGFMIVLPNLNFRKEPKAPQPEQTAPQDEVRSLEGQRSKLAVDLIQAKGPVSRMELEMVWGISRSAAAKWIDQLVNSGVLLRVGNGRNTKYTIAD